VKHLCQLFVETEGYLGIPGLDVSDILAPPEALVECRLGTHRGCRETLGLENLKRNVFAVFQLFQDCTRIFTQLTVLIIVTRPILLLVDGHFAKDLHKVGLFLRDDRVAFLREFGKISTPIIARNDLLGQVCRLWLVGSYCVGFSFSN
jgi:hypothetical protein